MSLFASASKRKWLWVVLPPVVAFLVTAKVLNTSPPSNRIETSPDATDVKLRTRTYDMPIEDVESAARQVVLQLATYSQSWRLPYTGRADDTMLERTIDVEVPVLFFTDDLTITLRAASDTKTQVDVVSRSRVGSGDFGENKRHILKFLSALDEKLAQK